MKAGPTPSQQIPRSRETADGVDNDRVLHRGLVTQVTAAVFHLWLVGGLFFPSAQIVGQTAAIIRQASSMFRTRRVVFAGPVTTTCRGTSITMDVGA